jgi:hypothetical protein
MNGPSLLNEPWLAFCPRRLMIMRSSLVLSGLEALRQLAPGGAGWRPPEDRPSPPPMGWSTGFMVTPRLCPRKALPAVAARPCRLWTLECSTLPTCPPCPAVRCGTRRTSPEGSRIWAQVPSLAITVGPTRRRGPAGRRRRSELDAVDRGAERDEAHREACSPA